ncbi:MliC family protein [Chitinibacter sp. ZOR0017]|uniref:MliC family protein n=1 Tax=Chitinibacter sp. ZOR0017 TaxID=1339254 RepID=UPI000689677C|nr:MliC family protein [Chitinibacter sp. ZOR0017]
MSRVVVFLAGCLASTSLWAAQPSFSCSQTQQAMEKLICQDAELAQLDTELAQAYLIARQKLSPQAAKALPAAQRRWLQTRNRCAQASEPKACATRLYQRRITELKLHSQQLPEPATVTYDCGQAPTIYARFYNDLDSAVALEREQEKVLLWSQPAASGARYGNASIEFWEHHGEALVNWHRQSFTCKPR